MLSASNYTYVEAVWTQRLPDWIDEHVSALAFVRGVPRRIVPDNLRWGAAGQLVWTQPQSDLPRPCRPLRHRHSTGPGPPAAGRRRARPSLAPLGPEQQRNLLELAEDRYGRGSSLCRKRTIKPAKA